jgi:hypothetical protein
LTTIKMTKNSKDSISPKMNPLKKTPLCVFQLQIILRPKKDESSIF